MTDFKGRTFLEYVSLASRERVYSAAFGWALDDRSPLPLANRLKIITELSGIDVTNGRTVKAIPEWSQRRHGDSAPENEESGQDGRGSLDLLLEVQPGPVCIAVENKIKAAESRQQLSRYAEDLRRRGETIAKMIFLTSTGERPQPLLDKPMFGKAAHDADPLRSMKAGGQSAEPGQHTTAIWAENHNLVSCYRGDRAACARRALPHSDQVRSCLWERAQEKRTA